MPAMPAMPRNRHRRSRRTRAAGAIATAVALLSTAGALGTSVALGTEPTGRTTDPSTGPSIADGRARIVSEKRLGPRTLDLTVSSPAVGTSLPVRIILPSGFDTEPDRTWPVLHLLQGAHDDYTSWTRETDIEEFLADKGVITVMPSSGPTGIPTAWWGHGRPGSPDFETFHVDEVMRLLRENYRASGIRAVAGVSTGGYGAMAFAARHPGSFGAAASYSGILDTTAPGIPKLMYAIVARELQSPWSLWGDPLLHRDIWNRHNPAAQAAGLSGTRLYISQGDGGPNGDPGELEGAVLESTLRDQAHGFARRLAQLGVPAQAHFYRGGSHAWPYWQKEFKASWPLLAAGLGLRGVEEDAGSPAQGPVRSVSVRALMVDGRRNEA